MLLSWTPKSDNQKYFSGNCFRNNYYNFSGGEHFGRDKPDACLGQTGPVPGAKLLRPQEKKSRFFLLNGTQYNGTLVPREASE